MMAVQRAGSEGGRKPISINVRKDVYKVPVYTSCNVLKSTADSGRKMRRRGQNREGETH
jgi:hypothetical protein